MSVVELIGPCRFGGWNANGSPIVVPVPSPLIQLAAVSEEQPLALDTRVRTTSGWTTVGDLHVGDHVFDEHGQPQRVMRETEVFTDKDCYRVTFDDGQSVVASAEHGWTFETRNLHGDKHVQTTASTLEMKELVDCRRGARLMLSPTQLPDAPLPVDPYVLGRWLGDGFSNNKHVPEVYLNASIEQRLALVQGMIDSDGHLSKGQYGFTNTNERLIDAFVELVSSLGEKPFKRERSGDAWVVTFVPVQDHAYARMARKMSDRKARFPYRYVRSVEPVPTVPVKCIGIDTESHLFQVERGILTHNTLNTMDMVRAVLTDATIKKFGLKVDATMVRADNGKRKLQCVTSNWRTLEGKRSTFVVLNETHHWLSSNNGHDMYRVIDGNVTKMAKGRYLCITNAYVPGEDSVAQRVREEYEGVVDGRYEYTGLMYDSVEAKPAAPLRGPLTVEVIKRMRGDAIWLDANEIVRSLRRPSIDASDSRRKWLNQIVADEEALHTPETWDALRLKDAALRPGDSIVLGFDGSKSEDSTALVAIRTKDRCAFLLHVQERPDGPEREGWQVNRERVHSAVDEAFAVYDVKGFFSDVSYWESSVVEWTESYGEGLRVKATDGKPIEWDMRREKNSTEAHMRLMQSLVDSYEEATKPEGEERRPFLKHDGDLRMRRHALNARRVYNKFGLYFGKESRQSPRKVDVYAAYMLAHEALIKLRTAKPEAPERSGRGWFI